jgi:hypothetical protein
MIGSGVPNIKSELCKAGVAVDEWILISET